MAGLFDVLFRGLTGLDRNAQTIDSTKETRQGESNRDSETDHLATRPAASPHKEEEEEPILEPEDVLPTMMTPFHASVYSKKTGSSGSFNTSRSLSTPGALSTPGVDISFGPQSPTFVTRRKNVHEGGVQLKVPENSPMSFFGTQYQSTPIAIRHPDGSLEEVDQVLVPSEEPVTDWRKEQVKYMRRARLSNAYETKGIPTFNGPLSLPYARNPSGVDAILADDSAYLTHVFGLRRGNHLKVHPTGTLQVTADGSTKFTPDYAKMTGEDDKAPSVRPLVIREPHQVIGIRQDTTSAAKDVPRNSSELTDTKSKAVEIKAPKDSAIAKETADALKASSAILRTESPATQLSEPANDPFNALFDQAIANATRHQSDAADFNMRSGANTKSVPPTRATYQDLLSLWKASNEAYARLPDDPTPLVPPKRVVSDDISRFGTPTAWSTPARASAPTTPGTKGTKADAAKTWRNKPQNRMSSLNDASTGSNDSSNDSMTIDELFDKFSTDEKEATPPKVSFKSPLVMSDPAIKESSTTPIKPVLKAKGRSPLGEMAGILNATPMKAVSAKGTPGAGKHLKTKADVAPKGHTAKSKGKAKEA